MALLVDASYDPSTAVSKSTAALLAMTALDTTNLRATFTAPSTGNILVVMRCNVHGGTAAPQVLLGVMNGSTILKRCPTSQTIPSQAASASTIPATSMVTLEAVAAISGLTPGASYSLDAAYDVETIAASSAIKYGGPNNTTANDAFGAFTYMVFSA